MSAELYIANSMTHKKNSLIQNVDAFCQKYNLLPPDSSIIIGLSGGPDSMFLLNYLARQQKIKNLKVIAAHLDHQWRKNSADDVTFCAEQAKSHGIAFISATALELGFKKTYHGSQEEYGRIMRRSFFEMVKQQENANLIALAHHEDDQVETFFIRLIRGTTISGLCSMRPQQGSYIHPLLDISKENIIEYLQTHDIPYLIDPSNESSDFLRNRIRHQVIPVLESIDTRFTKNTLRTIESLQETDDFLTDITKKTIEQISFIENNTLFLKIKELKILNSYLQKRVLFSWLCMQHIPVRPSAAWLKEILRFLFQQHGGTHQIHPEWSISKNKGIASIRKEQLE